MRWLGAALSIIMLVTATIVGQGVDVEKKAQNIYGGACMVQNWSGPT